MLERRPLPSLSRSRPVAALLGLLLALSSCSDSNGGSGGGAGGGGPSGPRVFRVGGEVALDPSFTLAEAAGDQSTPALSVDGSGFLGVWADANPAGPRVAASHIGASGEPTDPTGMPLHGALGLPTAVAGVGQTLVAFVSDGTLFTRRLATGGAPIDTAALAVGAAANGSLPAAAQSASGYLVVWARPGGEVLAARISPSTGRSLDGSGVSVARLTTTPSSVFATALGETFLVAWAGAGTSSCASCRVARVGANGAPLDPLGIPLAAPGGEPVALASDGQTLGALVLRAPSGELHGASLLATGAFVSPAFGLGISSLGDASLGYAGDRYVLAFASSASQLGGMLLTPNATPASLPRLLAPDSACVRRPQVAVASGVALMLWQNAQPSASGCSPPASSSAVLGLRFDRELNRLDQTPRVLSAAADAQSALAVAAAEDGALVAWRTSNSRGGHDIAAVRVAPSGAPFGSSTRITTSLDHGPPAALRQGATFVVAWPLANGSELRGARFEALGAGTLDPEGVAVAVGGGTIGQVAAAGGAAGVGVVTFARGNRLEAGRVGDTGQPLDPGTILLGELPANATRTSVAPSLDTFLALASAGSTFLGRARLSAQGNPLDPGLQALSVGSEGVVATGQSGWLAAWLQLDGALRGAALATDGALGEIRTVASASSAPREPSIAWLDGQAVIVWEGVSQGVRTILASRLDPNGSPRDMEGDRLFADTVERRRPRLARLGAKRALLVYERSVPTLGAVRAYAATLEIP